jgi:hypothetical protein
MADIFEDVMEDLEDISTVLLDMPDMGLRNLDIEGLEAPGDITVDALLGEGIALA